MQVIIKALHALILSLLGIPGLKELPEKHPDVMRARDAAEDVATVAVEMFPDDLPTAEKFARVGYVWGRYESSWMTNPKCPKGTPKALCNDDGGACGVMQVHSPELWVPGATCEKVRADRKLGFKVGLTLIRKLELQCGSLRAGLTAFSTNGTCPMKGWSIKLVLDRCRQAGVAC